MQRPTLPKMLRRGLVRRCPWCGGRSAFFSGWFGKHDTCSTCGLHWRRDDVGFELGAAAIAAIICMGPLVVLLAAILLLTWPDVDVVLLLGVFFPAAVLVPILLYPSSYTTWQAVDIMMRPVQADDFEGQPVTSRR